MDFRVGDRVKCISATGGNISTVGKVGTIQRIYERMRICSVYFDEDVGGHNNNNGDRDGMSCTYGHGWACDGEFLDANMFMFFSILTCEQ